MRRTTAALISALAFLVGSAPAMSEADGPDFWAVQGVRANDKLNMHRTQSPRSAIVARIPHNADGLRNLGCTKGPSFAQWEKMSAAERARSSRARWCKVSYAGKTGWVAGRFLREGGQPANTAAATTTRPAAAAAGAGASRIAIGPWTVACAGKACTVRQGGVGSARPANLIFKPVEAPNAEITLEYPKLPVSGLFTVYIDGKEITGGPIAPLRNSDGTRLILTPDDITLGLMRQMRTGSNMVVNFPGEDRGIEFRLDRFGEAIDFSRR